MGGSYQLSALGPSNLSQVDGGSGARAATSSLWPSVAELAAWLPGCCFNVDPKRGSGLRGAFPEGSVFEKESQEGSIW